MNKYLHKCESYVYCYNTMTIADISNLPTITLKVTGRESIATKCVIINQETKVFLEMLSGFTFIQNETAVRPTTWWKRLSIVILPVVITLWALGFHLGYPELKGFNFKGGIYLRNSLIALWIALSLYTAAFIAENVRSGIQAVAKGQSEAAYALGISPGRTMSLIILPQALRIIIPPVISQFLNLTKNSSLAIAVGYMDLTGTLMGITLNQTGRELETVLMGMAIYLIISLAISTVMNWYNNSVKLVER